jgi:hypothetical protein
MPIPIQAPDGSTVQFPDGMADADIEKVMAEHYPQPSFMDRVAGSFPARFAHDVIARPVEGLVSALPALMGAKASLMNGQLPILAGPDSRTAQLQQMGQQALDQPYQGALAHNRNTPGYAKERALADQATAGRGGLGDQLFAPFLPSVAGSAGLLGGLDSSNAMADAQEARQTDYAAAHPVLAPAAQLAGGLLMAGPEGVAKNLPIYGGDSAAITRAINPAAVGPFPINPRSVPVPPAVDYVRGLVAKSGKSPSDLSAFDSAGKPFTAAEAIGKPGEVALGALARRDGATPDALAAQIAGRQEDAPGRILDDFSRASGLNPAAARGDIKTLVAHGRQQAAPLYDEAYAQAPVITDRLAQFANEPIVQRGMREGIKTEQLNALAEGKPFDPNAYAITGFDAAGDPQIGPVPTWKTWDAAKLGLDDMLEKYRDTTTGKVVLDKRGRAIDAVRRSMLNQIDAVNPAYKAARAQAGDYLSAQDSFDKGGKLLLNGNMPVSDFAQHFSALDPADKQAFAGGSANNLFSLAQNGKLTPKVFNRPIIQQKLAVMLGPEKAQQFVNALQAENRMAGFARTRVPGAGSPSAEYLEAMRQQDGGGMLPDALGWVGQVVDNSGLQSHGEGVCSHSPTLPQTLKAANVIQSRSTQRKPRQYRRP